MNCRISGRALKRINRETGDPSVREALVSEAWLRKWLKLHGVPCWTAPSLPGAFHRYGLVTCDGTRLLVVPVITAQTMDEAAGACCGVTAVVGRVTSDGGGCLKGWLTLAELQRRDTEDGLNAPGDLPGFLGVPRRYAPAYIRGSLRLLLAGEPKPPDKGLDGVELYTPRPRPKAGEVHADDRSRTR